MRIVNFSDARKSLKSLIDQTVADGDFTAVTRRGAPTAVVMSLKTFNSLMETVHLLKTPVNSAHILESIGQHREGKTEMHELLEV